MNYQSPSTPALTPSGIGGGGEQDPSGAGVLSRLLPVRVRVVELPRDCPTHQQPPVVHDGRRRESAPPAVARPEPGPEPRRRFNLAACPRTPASQTALQPLRRKRAPRALRN